MEIITSKDNAKIRQFIKLLNKKSYRDQTGYFALEGLKLLIEADLNHVPFEMVFVTEDCFEKNSQYLEKLFQSVRGHIITEDISQKMTSQNTPQGVYAVCQKPDNLTFSGDDITAIKNDAKLLMLCDLQDAGNVGTIIRTAQALAINGIIVTKATCDIYSSKVLRGSMGGVFRIPIYIIDDTSEYDTTEFLKDMNEKDVCTYAAVVNDENAISVRDVSFAKKSLLLIGNEGNGLPHEISNLCKTKITINMAKNAESLNASQAAGILIWEMTKQ